MLRKPIQILLLIASLSGVHLLPAQTDPIVPQRTATPVEPDGVLDEKIWQTLTPITGFRQNFPTDTLMGKGQTEVRMAFDDNFLYVAVICHSTGADFVVQSLRRDYGFQGTDNITLLFDTFNDQTNAFVFGMNAYGARREALIANGGRQISDFASSWDNKWYGDARIYRDYWVAELAIPFRTLRYQEGGRKWRFNCYRSDTQINEWTSWQPIPQNRLVMDLSFMGTLEWPEPLKKPGTNISLIPYVAGNGLRDYEDPTQENADYSASIGGDAKIAVTPGLNLDLTANPDFSQVEVDRQVTNLDRFELFFPERRQFFLENADLFSSFGLSRVNPFFSRRIGITRDTATGQNIQNRIIYGARLSGKLNERLRVGLLNMQGAREVESGDPAYNFTVAALQQQVFDRSNVSFIFVNKQAINPDEESGNFTRYNRVAGLEYRLLSKDNRWSGKIFYHHVFDDQQAEQYSFSQGAQLEYLRKRYRVEWAHSIVGQGFDAEVGFVPRRDYVLMSPEAELFFYPEGGPFNQFSLNLDTRFFLQIGADGNDIIDPWGLSERQTELSFNAEFRDNARGSITATETWLTLLRDFDPTRLQKEGVVLPAGSAYHYVDVQAEYRSDQRQSFFYSLQPVIGQFYNGFRAGLGGSLTYRFQPYGSIAMNVNYNYIALAEPFEPASIWLVGPRLDLTFSKNVFLTSFIQYNNQLDNININTRLQWRFAPVSDLFLVYTDNYLANSFSQFDVRNRALVAKVTYWLNL